MSLAKGVAGGDEAGDHELAHIVGRTGEHREALQYRVERLGIHALS